MPGFLHGLADENPHIRSVRVRAASRPGWAPLLAEFAATGPGEVRLDGDRRVRDFAEVTPARGARLREGGRYLVTGGLGEVGRAIAEHLVHEYRAEVVVAGRSEPGPDQRRWLAEHGLHHERADVTSAAQTRDLVDRTVARLGRLDGVIHSAGVLRDALVHNKTAREAEAVLAPKLRGARHLDAATAGLDLDLFCLFGSIAGVLGNVGQSDYIAANRFLDEFAADRARQVARGERSGFTLAIDWPLWLTSESSRDARGALGDYLREEFGLEPLDAARGARLFAELAHTTPDDCHQVLACVGDAAEIRRRLLAPPVRSRPPRDATADTTDADFTERLAALVREQTGLRPADVTADHTWGDLGYSSVMLQDLAARVGAEFGVATPPNALFRYRTIRLLSAHLADRGAAPAPRSPAAPAPASEIPATREPAPRETAAPATGEPAPEGFAIIGMSGTLPGSEDIDGFWRLLVENRDAIRRVDRWKGLEHDAFAGTIDTYDRFDHTFFGVSAREAVLMDPQHRLFLQAAYNALLDAGLAPGSVRSAGVFAGVQFAEYQALLQTGPDRAHPYAVTGNAHTMLANRVSHLLDLDGPSQTVDTACSSALVALNRGVLSLAAGECDVALVGAVSVLVDPASTEAATGLGVLSPDFRCATFDRAANGYVRAEGVGCVVLKRLADARRDLDPVLAVVERVAENHNGRANSLTAPGPDAQVALLTRAYSPELAGRVGYVEAHGTGTALGDPIEVGALRSAIERLAPHRAPGAVALGAVKTNVGHLEPAAGVAGLVKAVLCLRHRQLPANLHFRELNPLIDLAGGPLRLLRENEEWSSDGPRVAGVSSFGFGGSNAHVVLSEPPAAPPPGTGRDRPGWWCSAPARRGRSGRCARHWPGGCGARTPTWPTSPTPSPPAATTSSTGSPGWPPTLPTCSPRSRRRGPARCPGASAVGWPAAHPSCPAAPRSTAPRSSRCAPATSRVRSWTGRRCSPTGGTGGWPCPATPSSRRSSGSSDHIGQEEERGRRHARGGRHGLPVRGRRRHRRVLAAADVRARRARSRAPVAGGDRAHRRVPGRARRVRRAVLPDLPERGPVHGSAAAPAAAERPARRRRRPPHRGRPP
ncbi:SDR family NAD(P)-dependent oxidoreductase [Amycolatopsis sp. Hca4]|nr:SDR family NAD(P)-dependent oxidoreductase [Amycolatopsis sp. Hca4]QKV80359.1 SDR family NAD(P)-dependent oxidoreductase [Amycolatopsis sp. Hca4]